MFSVRDEADFNERLTRELLKATFTKWKKWLKAAKLFLKQIAPKINIGNDPTNDFSVSFEWTELAKHKDEISMSFFVKITPTVMIVIQ